MMMIAAEIYSESTLFKGSIQSWIVLSLQPMYSIPNKEGKN